jgi:glycogen debranching enzyme
MTSDLLQPAADVGPAEAGVMASLGVVTLVEGSTFCVCGRSGDMEPGAAQGLFFRDTRILSTWRLTVDRVRPQVLTVLPQEPYRTMFVSQVPPPLAMTELLIERTRYVGDGMREDVRLRNLSNQAVMLTVSLTVDADFADLFSVKEHRARGGGDVSAVPCDAVLTLEQRTGERLRGVRIEAAGARAHRDGLEFDVIIAARGDWRTSVLVHPQVDGQEVTGTFPVGRPLDEAPPAQRLRAWREGSPRVETGAPWLRRVLARSLEDLGALRLFDPDHPGSFAVAAGAPWFMALFGRDSLLSSYMALPLDPSLALGTLQSLARLQGEKVDPTTEEEPGRILHETRFGLDFPLVHGGGTVYYGTADATPLFVVLLGELRRWGIAAEEVDALLPHADRALDWIEQYGDRDGDGFVEYQRMTERGLRNQGWKDSFDGINFADGHLAETPIALCEVQAYVYAAYLARAHFAQEAGDAAGTERWSRKADDLKRDFNDRFWLEEQGWFAVGLDRDKQPIDALASNMGHCLWTGLVDEDKAPLVAERLLSPELFTGRGIRTLATTMGAYNPMSYHNGSVWPHDNALIATGLMRYGFVEHAQRVAHGILRAAQDFDARLPELFGGFDHSEYPAPLPYPTSCSPQAWAAASPIQLMRALLRLDPWASQHRVWFAPAWPPGYGPLRIDNLPLGGARVALAVDGSSAELAGLPDEMKLIRQPRRPLTAALPAPPG